MFATTTWIARGMLAAGLSVRVVQQKFIRVAVGALRKQKPPGMIAWFWVPVDGLPVRAVNPRGWPRHRYDVWVLQEQEG